MIRPREIWMEKITVVPGIEDEVMEEAEEAQINRKRNNCPTPVGRMESIRRIVHSDIHKDGKGDNEEVEAGVENGEEERRV